MPIPPTTSTLSSVNPIDLRSFVQTFYGDQAPERCLGRFQKCAVESMPAHVQRLLAHEHHMTVTVEQHFNAEVDLKVLQSQSTGESYWRKIVLTLRDSGRVAMFGLVRIDLKILDAPVRDAIRNQHAPLGRILIENDVLRKVRLVDLYRIEPGEDLLRCWPRRSSGTSADTANGTTVAPLAAAHFADPSNTTTDGAAASTHSPCCYGRTALIYCDHRPVIELLEIVDGQIET